MYMCSYQIKCLFDVKNKFNKDFNGLIEKSFISG